MIHIQIYETRAIGADAVLLIVRVLGRKLKEFITLADSLGLAALVEVHTENELAVALAAGAEIIGINNRNLDTFVTDINTSCRLRRMVPEGQIVVAESGINSREDIELLLKAGINCFLVGEALITAEDSGKKLRELNGERLKNDAGKSLRHYQRRRRTLRGKFRCGGAGLYFL